MNAGAMYVQVHSGFVCFHIRMCVHENVRERAGTCVSTRACEWMDLCILGAHLDVMIHWYACGVCKIVGSLKEGACASLIGGAEACQSPKTGEGHVGTKRHPEVPLGSAWRRGEEAAQPTAPQRPARPSTSAGCTLGAPEAALSEASPPLKVRAGLAFPFPQRNPFF